MLGELIQQDKIVGTKQVLKALGQGKVKKVYLAADADVHLKKKILTACAQAEVECAEVPSMKELGEACGIDVGAACAAIAK